MHLRLVHEKSDEFESDRGKLKPIYFDVIMAGIEKLKGEEFQFVRKARRFMNENIGRPISLDDIAHAVAMSKFHFVREYKRVTERSPMADLRHMRIEKAKYLLRTTSLPLKAIAPMVGFANENHLSRLFPKYTGHTTRYYRNRRSQNLLR